MSDKNLIELLQSLPPATIIRKKRREWIIYSLEPGSVVYVEHPEIKTALEYYLEAMQLEQEREEWRKKDERGH